MSSWKSKNLTISNLQIICVNYNRLYCIVYYTVLRSLWSLAFVKCGIL